MTSINDSQKEARPEGSGSRPSRSHWWFWLLLMVVGGVLGGYAYMTHADEEAGPRSAKQGAPLAQMSVPVVAASARQGDISIYLNGLGSVVPSNTVTVKSRVDGQLMKVYFQEGQMVANGALLAEIDPRPFQVMLDQAQGQMARDQAQLKNAQLDYQRYKTLVAQDSIAKQQVDTQEALVRQLEGTVKVDQSQIDNAKLQLDYARITAPIGGRIGLRQVDIGNIVHASDTSGLAVITQMQPIAVVFSIPEDNLPPVLEKLREGKKLKVEAFNREQSKKLAEGYLLTVDNQIDPNTGTVKLKAEFPNKHNELFPNQFVNARLLLDTRRGATVVPASALQRSPKGTFVYLIKEDKTVSVRPVKVGPSEGDDLSIDEGLAVGDQVVVEGAERLHEGSKVEVQVRSEQ